jgi:hypothetical protein
MRGDSQASNLVLGGAVATFVLTVVMFISSVVGVRATDCYDDGLYGIGPNCIEEWQGQFSSCFDCAVTYCMLLSGGGSDAECLYSCLGGADESGCF